MRQKVLVKTAAALFYAHSGTALELIWGLPKEERDKAYSQICDFILQKIPTSDPYDGISGDGFLLTYEEAVDLCDLLKLMSHDSKVYRYIEFISDSLVSKQNRLRISEQQKADIADRLIRLIDAKFPDSENIKHDGYKIAAQAQVARIQKTQSKDWEMLLQSAHDNIPNIADRSLVLCMIATAMPAKDLSKSREVIQDAKQLIDNLPVDFDRIDRYIALAQMVKGVDTAISKECLKSAMEFSIRAQEAEFIQEKQRRIIDLAHKLVGSSYATSLAALIDDEPARKQAKIAANSRLQLLDFKKAIADAKPPAIDVETQKTYYPKAAWLNLAGLNAGRIRDVHLSSFVDHITVAASLPLQKAYPILAWAIENAIRRLSRTDQARTHLVPLFEAAVLGTELAGRIAARSSDQVKQVKQYAQKTVEDQTNIIIRAGEREKALQFLKEWFAHSVSEYLKICDQFFGVNDLEILQILKSANPGVKCSVLTSRKQQAQDKLSQQWDEAFQNHWRIHISDQEPPTTKIVIVGVESSGKSPIHERWWLTKDGGIKIGTSFNSLGITQTSEISILSPEEAAVKEYELNQYLNLETHEHNGEKLRYNLFMLV